MGKPKMAVRTAGRKAVKHSAKKVRRAKSAPKTATITLPLQRWRALGPMEKFNPPLRLQTIGKVTPWKKGGSAFLVRPTAAPAKSADFDAISTIEHVVIDIEANTKTLAEMDNAGDGEDRGTITYLIKMLRQHVAALRVIVDAAYERAAVPAAKAGGAK